MKQVAANENDKSGNISDLGSKLIREFQKFEPSKISSKEFGPRNSKTEDEHKEESKKVGTVEKRRRSKTGDIVMGLG
eukprot:CAMPEP_0168353238 /NCGR_PEP_ID=MMETSP0213-20121227/23121_1 /TAXON_ID=151035 /ORGANISM="Euplotes harpa, Strain FSP1.4" /LENGTH=76 /DNA_ID=CAMNT_0008364789 /DNA_START=67 /DNA_END=294 /DNA_ORIENTATION=+